MPEARGMVGASAATAWTLLTDTHAWPHWGPTVRAVDCPTRFIEAGSCGRVQTRVGLWLPFRVTGWERNTFWSWKVAGIGATGHAVSPVTGDSCMVTFTLPAWAPLYLPVCHAALVRLDQLARQPMA